MSCRANTLKPKTLTTGNQRQIEGLGVAVIHVSMKRRRDPLPPQCSSIAHVLIA